MNALNVTALKVSSCAVVAAAVTLFASYAFVASTAVVKAAPVPTHKAVSMSDLRLARAGSTGLLQ